MLRLAFNIITYLTLLYASAAGAITTVCDGTLLDCQAKVTAAAKNDTVIIPSGNWNWDDTLTLTKGIILQGQGIDTTTINSTGGSAMVLINPTTPEDNDIFRITGLTLDGVAGSTVGVSIQNSSTTAILTNIRIDNNKIQRCAKSIYVVGLVYGLIDNNTLMANSGVTNTGIFYLSGKNEYSWAVPLETGTEKSLYIEDNIISGTNGWWVTQTNEGTRWVFRHNIVDLTNSDGILDWHGNQPTDTSYVPTSCLPSNHANARGAVGVEVYNNTFTNIPNYNAAMNPRGGTSIIYNNTITANTTACNTPAVKMVEEDAGSTSYGACSPLKKDYPGYDPLIGYFWNNKHKNGSNAWTDGCITYNYPTDPTMIPERVSYWADIQRESVNATTYWTSGLAVNRNPSVCTAENVYWETDTNKLYRCTATNTWTLQYTPYTYPHPLRGLGKHISGGTVSGGIF